MNRIFIIFLAALVMVGCKGKPDNEKMQDADMLLTAYEEHQDTAKLEKAAELYGEITDSAYIKDAVSRELSIFIELGQNEKAVEYLEKLDDSCFEKSYQRQLNLCVFQAKILKKQGKLAEANKKYDEAVKTLKSYLAKKTDEETLYELLMIEMEYKPKTEIINELNTYLNGGQYSRDLIEELIKRVEHEPLSATA